METFALKFTSEELNVIFTALQDLPFKKVAPVIDTINAQLQAAYAEKQRQAEQENQVKEVAKKAQ